MSASIEGRTGIASQFSVNGPILLPTHLTSQGIDS